MAAKDPERNVWFGGTLEMAHDGLNWGPSRLSGRGEFTEMEIMLLLKLKLMLMLAPCSSHLS